MPITSGFISYERRVKTGDFEHKHAAVTVHYAADPGEDADALISLAGALATKHVFAALRASTAPQQTPAPAPVADAPVADSVVADPNDVVAEVIPPATNLKAARRRVKKDEPIIVSQSDVVVETSFEDAVSDNLKGVANEVSEIIDSVIEDFVAEAPAASDAELGQALSRVAAKLKDRPKIQALIGEFVQSGQSYTLIPNPRRAEFIGKLEALA